MRTIKKQHWSFILLLPIFLLLANCEEEENNIDEISDFALASPALTAPGDGFSLVLDRENRDDVLRFEWEKADSERDFLVTYNVMLDVESGDFSDPLLEVPAADNGVQTFVEVSYFTLDLALSEAGFEPNAITTLKWAVEAVSINQRSMSSAALSLQRFDVQGPPQDLFIGGAATEVGADISNALQMNKLEKADGSNTNIFQIYTSLESGADYNFFSSRTDNITTYTVNVESIEIGETPIIAPETGVYRITVDFDTETFSLFKIDKWSIVGNVITDGWGGDEPLEYMGGGVWQSSIELVDADPGDTNKRFIFRANGDWGQVFKEIPGTSGELAFEGTAAELGFDTINDIAVSSLGAKLITINLNGDGYFYTVE
ncbi:MAG: SusE domain-containing protein [Saonia sp.]